MPKKRNTKEPGPKTKEELERKKNKRERKERKRNGFFALFTVSFPLSFSFFCFFRFFLVPPSFMFSF
jgi:hypothetical protein